MQVSSGIMCFFFDILTIMCGIYHVGKIIKQ